MSEITPEAAEFVPTPAWCVRRFLEAVDLRGRFWIEMCVGEGHIVRAVNEVRGDVHWTVNDIRPVPALDCYGRLHREDFARFSNPHSQRFSVGMSNLPFSRALPIVKRAREVCDAVTVLLPLAWPSGGERFDFLREHPCDVYVLPDRPWEFVRDVAWFRWPSVGDGFRILNKTPLAERKADALAAQVGHYSGPEQLVLA